jgi:Glycosyl hydrolase catalytic core
MRSVGSHGLLLALAYAAICGQANCGQSASDAASSSSPEAAANQSEGHDAGADAEPSGHAVDAGASLGADAAAPEDAGANSAVPTDASSADAVGDARVPYKGVANSPCADLATLRVAWYYNWTLSAGKCTTPPFVPMIWGHTGNEQSASGIAKEVAGIVAAGYDTVLGFNEPDNASQSNLSVATAVSLWPSFTGNASLRVGSPATQANSSGQAWFKSFMQQVDADTTGKLRVDFIAAHWYGWNSGSCDKAASSFESYVRWLEALPGQRPIWLTEWGCLNSSNPTPEVVQAFFSGAVAMFAKHPRIERYAWYPWTTNNELIVKDGGTPTALGAVFAAAPPYK